MKSGRKSEAAKGAIEVVEEVFQLLRKTLPGALAAYYFGSLPFILGLLYFWADMSKSGFAYTHLTKEAFALALLFVWMKCWQTIYARQLWAEIGGESTHWTPRRIFRMVVRQTIIQSSGMFLLPMSLIMVVPFGWVYAFYQNITVLDDGESADIRSLVRKAEESTKPWQLQNHLLIWMLSPYLMVTAAAFFLVVSPVVAALTPHWSGIFLSLYAAGLVLVLMPLSPIGVMIGINIASAIALFPTLLHILTGIQTPFLLNIGSIFNTTFFAVVCGLTYLCMDPLMKAAYVLRSFYVRSAHSGEDLKAELKHLSGTAKASIILCILAATLAIPVRTSAQETEVPAQKDSHMSISASELNQALDRELEARQYAWRMPRKPPPSEKEGIAAAFIRGIAETLADWGETIMRRLQPFMRWLDDFFEWLRKRMPTFKQRSGHLSDISPTLQLVMYIFLAVLFSTIGVMVWRTWRKRGKSFTVYAQAVRARPDLEKETTTAAELPEDAWLTLARELIQKGELRLALRAVFLASLAYLAQCNFIHLALFKSNYDYRRELERRAHAQPGMLDIFSQNTTVYESVWYGMHEANYELIERLMANQEKLQGYGAEK